MKRIRLKPYVIHILAVPALSEDAFDLPMEQNAVLVCSDRENLFMESGAIQNMMICNFQDVERANLEGAFHRGHARAVVRFLQGLPESVTDLYVCCSKGGSRSPAMAAAILRGSGRSDRDVWRNPYYVPNTLVYRRMCRELGIPMTRLSAWLRSRRNAAEYKKAKKRGNSGKYERWQLLP